MAIVHDDIGRRRFLSQAVMGFGMLFGLGTLGFRFLQFLLPTPHGKEAETVLIGVESRIPLGEAVPMALGGRKILVLTPEEGVAASSRQMASANPVEVILRVKDFARELGGIKNLKILVDLLAD